MTNATASPCLSVQIEAAVRLSKRQRQPSLPEKGGELISIE
jgi:hypothetical protein